MSGSSEIFLQARGLAKSFSGITVLRDVSLDIRSRQVHAIMGENGAGKSTLMKILAGFYIPDRGYLQLADQRVVFKSPHDALENGIAMIQQELLPFPNMTVAENICMGIEPTRGKIGWVDKKRMEGIVAPYLKSLGCFISPWAQMSTLTVAEMQIVELAKALVRKVKMIIMDEPTSALSRKEVEALLRIIQDLRSSGIALVYISHRMQEVFELADVVTVLRDGEMIVSRPLKEMSESQLIRYMVGRDITSTDRERVSQKGETLLKIHNLSKAGKFQRIKLDIKKGEILGIAGLMGAGRTDLAHAICGIAPADCGEIQVNGTVIKIDNPSDAFKHGIAWVVEDRKRSGLVMQMSVKHNMTLKFLAQLCQFFWIGKRQELQLAYRWQNHLNIKCNSLDQNVANLSGGNQQKAMLAMALMSEPKIVLLDEPTKGIDVAAKQEIHDLIRQLAAQGRGIMLISSEMPEILTLSHRILVMRQGKISGELDPEKTSQDEILKLCMPTEENSLAGKKTDGEAV